jgi:hypothetical protein
MRIATLLFLFFGYNVSYACPDLTGNYSCEFEINGEKIDLNLTQDQQKLEFAFNSQSSESKLAIPLDGQELVEYSYSQQRVATGSCLDTSVIGKFITTNRQRDARDIEARGGITTDQLCSYQESNYRFKTVDNATDNIEVIYSHNVSCFLGFGSSSESGKITCKKD